MKAFPFLVFLLVLPGSACAYLDAGTGSIFLQIITALLFSTLYYLKSFRALLSGMMRKLLSRKSPPD
jgi:hypothetical protein